MSFASFFLDHMLEPFLDFPFSSPSYVFMSVPRSSANKAPMDWKETAEAHVIEVNLPGMKREEVEVDVDDDTRVLMISGVKKHSSEKQEEECKFHLAERSCGKFMRKFRLPENAKVEEIRASMVDGVLSVVVPKVEEKKLRSVEIVDG